MSDRTKVVSVHLLRRRARSQERRLQGLIDRAVADTARGQASVAGGPLIEAGVPAWARGVRVEKAGLFQWAVVATEHRGR